MTKVLFGQAYYLRFDPKLFRGMRPYPPLGCLYAAAYLRDRGFEVALFDAMLADSEEEWATALDLEKPRYAVLFEDNFNYLSKMCLLRMREAAFRMIRAARARGVTVIVAGADATDHAERYLDQGADYVLLGEGEATLGLLMDHLAGRREIEPSDLRGLAWRDVDGRVVENARRPVLRDLDALPLPAWDLVDLERYRRLWLRHHGHFSLNLVTTRGCPFHCNWCAKPIWGQRYKVRSPERVVEEMALLWERYRPDHIWFADDIFGLRPGWLEAFAQALEDRGLSIPFKALSRADLLVRPGEVEALARAGCTTLWMGAESGSQKVLDAMDKGTSVDQIEEATRRLKRAGIAVGFFLQFGYPGETLDDVEATLDLVRRTRPDEIGVSVSYPLPGTPFFEAVQAELGEKQNWVDSEDLDMMYEGPFTTRFYRRLHTRVHRELHLGQAAAELEAVLRHPTRLRARHLRRAAGAAYRLAALRVDRLALGALARLPHRGIGPLPTRLSFEQASRPTPQEA